MLSHLQTICCSKTDGFRSIMFPSVCLESFKGRWKSAFAFVQRAISIERTCGMKLAYIADNQPHICRGKWMNCHINEKCQITKVTRKRRRILTCHIDEKY